MEINKISFNELYLWIQTSKNESIDIFLSEIDIKNTNTIKLLSLIKFLFYRKNKLFNYNDFIQRVNLELLKRNLDADALLKGLT